MGRGLGSERVGGISFAACAVELLSKTLTTSTVVAGRYEQHSKRAPFGFRDTYPFDAKLLFRGPTLTHGGRLRVCMSGADLFVAGKCGLSISQGVPVFYTIV